MTRLLEKAFSEASKLPKTDQNSYARWILKEMASEKKWYDSFAKSGSLLERMAGKAFENHRDGKTTPLNPDQM